ncbi:MAG: MBL fold metallo-hydrolase [Candidatus Leucobacter sulfamidivorax]|nr:MBL fold metallo-hydrolase [Candidatus Leucobacter sulfamidivorax]
MQCFRLSHAGFVIEDGGSALVIDPGNFSDERELGAALDSAAPIAALVITHEHPDHWTAENVAAVRSAAPDAPIFTTAPTAAALAAAGIEDGVHTVRDGDAREAGPFSLEFYGRRHELLHSSIPVVDNVGVRVNGVFAYGGDSLMRPPFPVDLLGVPIGSPWSNLSQVMDFVIDAAPRRAYLTHDGMLSAKGLGLFAQRVQWCLERVGGELVTPPRLDGDPGARLAL